MNITFCNGLGELSACDGLILFLPPDAKIEGAIASWDEQLGGFLTRLQELGDLPKKSGEASLFPLPSGSSSERLVLVTLCPDKSQDNQQLKRAIRTGVRKLTDRARKSVAVVVPTEIENVDAETFLKLVGYSSSVDAVGQDFYKEEKSRNGFEAISLVAPPELSTDDLESAFQVGRAIGEATNVARELIDRAAHEIYPETVADRISQLANEYGLDIRIFDEAQLAKERMHSMLAVAQGSERPPRMVILEHRGGDEGAPHVALIGKGVTFDSGGLSLKPSDGMKAMKADMAGAASVLATMLAIAKLNLPLNVKGYMGYVENMPSGSSYKLGDVLTARNGVTIEVHNTDAEGRLVLADVLSYAVDENPSKMIDLATLTGSCVVALGEDVAGGFTNDQSWFDQLKAASDASGDALWQLPMFDAFAEQLKSDVADCKNIGTRWGGAITAAKFLEKFVSDVPWVHLDIAGPAFAMSKKPYRDGGATGAMIPALVRLLQQEAEG